jgi:glucose uptake protein GlcU
MSVNQSKPNLNGMTSQTPTLFGLVIIAGPWTGGLAVMMGLLPQRVIIVGLVLSSIASTTILIDKRFT